MATNKQNKYPHKYSKRFCCLIKRNNPNQNHGLSPSKNWQNLYPSRVARARVFLTVYSFLSRTLETKSNLNMAENGGVEVMVVFQHLFNKVS